MQLNNFHAALVHTITVHIDHVYQSLTTKNHKNGQKKCAFFFFFWYDLFLRNRYIERKEQYVSKISLNAFIFDWLSYVLGFTSLGSILMTVFNKKGLEEQNVQTMFFIKPGSLCWPLLHTYLIHLKKWSSFCIFQSWINSQHTEATLIRWFKNQ